MGRAYKVRDRFGRVVRGQYNYRGYRIINCGYDGWSVHILNNDGTADREEVACASLLCLAKKAVDKLLAG